eukprot:jgi/Mesvir1/4706/Mv05632-RA.1
MDRICLSLAVPRHCPSQCACSAVAPWSPCVLDQEKKEKKKKKDKAAVVLDPENALLDPVEEKLRQQRLVEEADYKATQELFKGTSGAAKSIDDFIPKTLADFQALGELVAAKVTPFEKSLHYLELLKALVRAATAGINSEKVKELGASVTVIANNKLKDEKAAHGEGKKKKTAAAKGKKNLNLDAEEDNLAVEADDGWDGEDGYDDGYDFM